mmetsp:Transcript_39010/g.105660  ORF Transcript_39010/g.105660 Transcript_39010/m.105660 type:complete len:250 (+) Transcript_39010:129-878(+)
MATLVANEPTTTNLAEPDAQAGTTPEDAAADGEITVAAGGGDGGDVAVAGEETPETPSNVLIKPRMVARGLEVSVCQCPKAMRRELKHVFTGKTVTDDWIAIPTNQHSEMDLVNVGDDVEFEKDRCLNVFMDFGKAICEQLRSCGYWADYIDPCSGLPMLTPNCNKVYSEVDGMQMLMHYPIMNAAMCKILLHPKWGSAVYPATVFTDAPFSAISQLLKSSYFVNSEDEIDGDVKEGSPTKSAEATVES